MSTNFEEECTTPGLSKFGFFDEKDTKTSLFGDRKGERRTAGKGETRPQRRN